MLASGNYCYDSKAIKILREDISDGWEEFRDKVLDAADSAFYVDMDDALKRNGMLLEENRVHCSINRRQTECNQARLNCRGAKEEDR